MTGPFYSKLKLLSLLGQTEISPLKLKPYVKNMPLKKITEEIITYEFARFSTIPNRPVGERAPKKTG